MLEKPIVILDANAFITGTGLLQLGSNSVLLTTPSVLDELRDPKTREEIDKFPFEIQQRQPNKKSIQFVKQFARKTGDLASLSEVDIQLIALAHTQYGKKGLSQKIRTNPPPLKEWVQKEDIQENEESQESQSDQSDQSEDQHTQPLKEPVTNNQQQQQIKENVEQLTNKEQNKQDKKSQNSENENDDQWIVVPKNKKKKKQQSDEDLDSQQGWITPENFDRKMAQGTATFAKEEESQQTNQIPTISLMTADFAMQNVALQMGIQLKSLDGRKIKQVRRFILECYLCWKQYKIDNNEVKLCKECGYNSLSKISYSLSPNGDMILHRKKGWKPNQKILEWKQRKYEEQQKKKKHQHARRKKQASIFEA